MFDIGPGELVLLFVIALLVLGPQRLPKVASELGKWVGRARRTANELRRQLEREIELSEITRPPPPPAPPPPASPPVDDGLPPDPYTPEAQHGNAPAESANPEAAAEAPAPIEPAVPSADPQSPGPSQDAVHSPHR